MKKHLLIIVCCISGLTQAQVPTSGLVARYDFSTTASVNTDGSSSGYTLCDGGTPDLELGRVAGDSAVYFSGNEYKYYCGGNGTGFTSGSVSIAAWFRLSQINTYNTIAVMRYDINFSPYNGINLFVSGGANPKIACAISNGVEMDNITYGTTTLQLGQWYHAVCTYSSTTGEAKVYLNNVAEGTSALTASDIIYANDEFTIGHIPTGAGANGFIGHIDQVLYYNRAITANEVCEIYTGAACAAPNAPTNLSATLNGSNHVDLTWTDNSSDETTFSVQRSEDGGVNYSTIATPIANSTAYQDINTNPSTTYYYRVYATNNFGNSGISNVVSVSTNAVGIDETSEDQISVAPNPSSGTFTVQTPELWQQAQLTITGINGMIVYQSRVNTFTAPELEKGIYLLTLTNPGKMVIKRIVIQ